MTAFNPSEFLGTAQDLVEDEREAYLRTAVSRAYYAIFLLARDAMAVTLRDGRAHRETRERLMAHKRRMGTQLSLLHGLRKMADYEVEKQLGRKRASNALNIARGLHCGLLRLKANSIRQGTRQQPSESVRP